MRLSLSHLEIVFSMVSLQVGARKKANFHSLILPLRRVTDVTDRFPRRDSPPNTMLPYGCHVMPSDWVVQHDNDPQHIADLRFKPNLNPEKKRDAARETANNYSKLFRRFGTRFAAPRQVAWFNRYRGYIERSSKLKATE